MTPILSTVMKSGRAAIVALTLGAATITALPAQAQSEPSLNFQLGMGNDGNTMSFGQGQRKRGNDRFFIDRCLTNSQVERGLRHYGFRNVDVIRNLGRNRVLVVASWRSRDYSMRVNKCTGEVSNVQRLRKFRGQPGFSLQFNF